MTGAKAKIYLNYDGSLEQLADKFRKELCLTEFYIKNDTTPPYHPIAMSESLGFEIWLKKLDNEETSDYLLEVETIVAVENFDTVTFSDLSKWLLNHISKVSGIAGYIPG